MEVKFFDFSKSNSRGAISKYILVEPPKDGEFLRLKKRNLDTYRLVFEQLKGGKTLQESYAAVSNVIDRGWETVGNRFTSVRNFLHKIYHSELSDYIIILSASKGEFNEQLVKGDTCFTHITSTEFYSIVKVHLKRTSDSAISGIEKLELGETTHADGNEFNGSTVSLTGGENESDQNLLKFIIEFSNGLNVLVTSRSKLDAIELVSTKYKTLFNTESFSVKNIGIELDSKGSTVEY